MKEIVLIGSRSRIIQAKTLENAVTYNAIKSMLTTTSRYVPLYFGYSTSTETIAHTCELLLVKQKIPILAYAEKNSHLSKKDIIWLNNKGVLFIASAKSFHGDFTNKAYDLSQYLVKEKIANFIGFTPCTVNYDRYYASTMMQVTDSYGKDFSNEIFMLNPLSVAKNEVINVHKVPLLSKPKQIEKESIWYKLLKTLGG